MLIFWCIYVTRLIQFILDSYQKFQFLMPIFLLSFFLFHYTVDDDDKDKVEVSRDFKENVIEPILKVIREEILECIYCVTV